MAHTRMHTLRMMTTMVVMVVMVVEISSHRPRSAASML
jgi:hypothetical protein